MAAWDLPAEGTFAGARADRQTLKQVYPGRPMTKHEQSLFVTEAGRAELPLLKDHGFRFLTAADALEGRPEAVKRALSTFTASIPELRTFRKSELVRKFRTHAYDTGSARVQGELILCRRHCAAAPPVRGASRPLPPRGSSVLCDLSCACRPRSPSQWQS